MEIEPYDDSRFEAVARLSLRAWAPVFESVEQAMGSDLFNLSQPVRAASEKVGNGAEARSSQTMATGAASAQPRIRPACGSKP